MQRPKENQREYWCYKKYHAYKFLGVTAPNGLCVYAWGACGGRHPDVTALHLSGLMAQLALLHVPLLAALGRQFHLYGDAAFPFGPHLQVGYNRIALNHVMQQFNQVMSGVRITVEWFFGLVSSLWPMATTKKMLQIEKMPLAKLYFSAILLTNCHTCMYNNQMSEYFEIKAPALEDYLDVTGSPVPRIFV